MSREHHGRLKVVLLAMGVLPTGNYALDYAITIVKMEDDETENLINEMVERLQNVGKQLAAADALAKAADDWDYWDAQEALKEYREATNSTNTP